MTSSKFSIFLSLFLLHGIFADISLNFSKTNLDKEDAVIVEEVARNKSTKSRNKRGDCLGNWNFNLDCSCSYSLYSEQSIRDAVTSVCTSLPSQTCYLSCQQSAVWTTVKPDERFDSVQCQPEQCYDSNVGYTCTCQSGYEGQKDEGQTGCKGQKRNENDLSVYLPATIVPGVVLLLVIMGVCYWKYRKKKQLDDANQCITIKCDVLFVVDAKDEFKRYTEQLTVALRETFKDIIVKRMDIFVLYSGKYSVKCDKAVFILKKEHKSLELCFETVLSKITFRKRRKTAFVIFNETDKVQTERQCLQNNVSVEENKNDTDVCWVSEIKKLEEWIPSFIKTIFNIRLGSNSNCNTYFIKQHIDGNRERTCTYIKVLSSMLDKIFTSSGAVKSSSFGTATCKIIVVDDCEKTNDEINTQELQGCHIFSTRNSIPSDVVEINSNNFYFRDNVITGVLNVLLEMNIITRK